MSLLSDKINSYAIETGISFDSAYSFPPVQTGTVTNTNAADWLLTGIQPVYQSGVSPVGGGGSWNFVSNTTNGGCRLRNTGTVKNAINDGDYSVGLWVKFNDLSMTGSTAPLMAWQPAFTGGYLFSLYQSGGKYFPQMTYASTGAAAVDFTTELNTTDWFYYAITKVGSEVKFYINGALKVTVTNAQTPTATTLNFGQISQGYQFSTNLANFYVASPSVIGATEIAEIWTAGAGLKSLASPLKRTTNSYSVEYSIEMNEAFTLNPTISGTGTLTSGNKFTFAGENALPTNSTLGPIGGKGSWKFTNANNLEGCYITSTSAITNTWADGDFSVGFWVMTPGQAGTFYNERSLFRISSSAFDIQLAYGQNASNQYVFSRSIDGATTWTDFGPVITPNQWYFVSIKKSNATNTVEFAIDVTNTSTASLTATGTGGSFRIGPAGALDGVGDTYISNFYIAPTSAIDSTALDAIKLAGTTAQATLNYYDGITATWKQSLNPYVWNGTKWVLWSPYRRLSDQWLPIL